MQTVRDILALCGAAFLVAGFWQAATWAGMIALGCVLLTVAILWQRNAKTA